ncbi:class I SAM-dependent methyltransferase [Streptomyces hoynatensis]|nr:class I SAM-dependent methyltransferase [Streptomyces hoynatensis]
MPPDEGRALHEAAVEAAARLRLPLLEIGSYCGRSTLLLAEAARRAGTVVVTVDHHRGSEEQQPGQEYHDRELVDHALDGVVPVTGPDAAAGPAAPGAGGRLDTLPFFRRTVFTAGLEEHVIAVVGRSPQAAAALGGGGGGRFGLVFVDGGHTDAHATADYESWVPQLALGGLLVIHDVFEDPAEGGQAPYRIWRRALDSGAFAEGGGCRSLRVLRRTGRGL